jgi:hypothetical protein
MKTTPETIILAVAIGFLAAGAGSLGYFFPQLVDLTGVTSTDPHNSHNLKPLHADDLQTSLGSWSAPAAWQAPADGHLLFISDPYLFYPSLYPSGKYIQPDDGTARSPRGVLLSWYRKYHIDFTVPGVDVLDPDGDGFSNVIEFKNEPVGKRLNAYDCDGSGATDPNNPQSHPDYLGRLRLEKYDSRPFHVQFRGYEQLNGVYSFQIYLKDMASNLQPRLKKTGDPLGFEGYTVGDFHLNIVKEKDPATGIVTDVDESTLDLVKSDIGFKITLIYRKEVDAPESTADFIMLMPSEVGKEIKAARDKTFTIPYLTNKQFLVVDVNDNGAVIRDMDPKNPQDIPVLKLLPTDWDEVPAATAPAKSQ